MTPEELVERIQRAIPGRLCSAVLYGSAAAGDFVPETSNYNVLLVVDRLDRADLDALSKPSLAWAKAGHRPPLLFTPSELKASADWFPIELLDIQQSRHVLFGDDPLAGITVQREHLRLQLERELKEKLLALREGYLLTGGSPKRVLALLTASVASFLVLFRAALRLFQENVPREKIDAVKLLSQHIPFDPRPLVEIDAIKHRQRKPREVAPQALFESYLTTIEQVVDAIGRHLHPQTGSASP
jgi:hypothetical protein